MASTKHPYSETLEFFLIYTFAFYSIHHMPSSQSVARRVMEQFAFHVRIQTIDPDILIPIAFLPIPNDCSVLPRLPVGLMGMEERGFFLGRRLFSVPVLMWFLLYRSSTLLTFNYSL
ncbi:hypothetical protein JTE90_012708 [Oedothorax gibbosus]|uniref:Uncharacterized protein n=1 Tax=Oedothorax gibbosus TaxID=931172 RepID=A0AAV6W301_9ARAC|nr:hypothetical protein JTE90_012708 [Oedothorax gibbosus]